MLRLNYRVTLTFLTGFFFLGSAAQHDISRYEIAWAFLHPVAAIKIKNRLPQAMLVYQQVKHDKLLDTLGAGGKLDAFRHAYVMAYLSRSIGVKKLRKLGKAHEKGNKRQFEKHRLEEGEQADSLACEMDLRNNELGFLIGYQNREKDPEALKQILLAELKAGKAWYFKRNHEYQYLSCDGKILLLSEFRGKWGVPKCLIPTDQ